MVHQRENAVQYQKKNQCVLKQMSYFYSIEQAVHPDHLVWEMNLGWRGTSLSQKSLTEELWAGISDFMCKIEFGVLVQCL